MENSDSRQRLEKPLARISQEHSHDRGSNRDFVDQTQPTSTDVTRRPPGRSTRPMAGDAQYGRSSVSNGKRLHLTSDAGNASWQRRYKDVFNLIASDSDDEVARQQVRRVVSVALVCERYESALAAGKAIDMNQYGMMSDRFSRAIECLYGLRSERK
jgi:hypothetical protein